VAEGASGSERELRERLDVEAAMSSISRAFIDRGPEGTDECITEGLAHVGALSGADRAFVYVSADRGATFDNTHGWVRDGLPWDHSPRRGLVSDSFPHWWATLQAGGPIVVGRASDLGDATIERRFMDGTRLQAVLMVPMMLRDEPIGFVGLGDVTRERDWSPATVSLLGQFAAVATTALERRATEVALRASEERFRLLVQNSPDAVIVIDALGLFTYASPQIEALLGYAPDALVGTSSLDLIHPDDADDAAVAIATAVEAAIVTPGETGNGVGLRVRHANGSYVPVEVTGSSLLDDPVVGGIIVSVRDMRESIRIAATLEEIEIRFRQVFDHSPIGMTITGVDGRYAKVNAALCEMLGYSADELAGITMTDLAHPDDVDTTVHHFEALLRGESRSCCLEKRYRCRDGNYVWARVTVTAVTDAANKPLYFIAHVENVTERKQIEDRMAYDATHDALTGLPLRTLLLDHLELALAGARRHSTRVAVLFIDLDRFKHVNDSMGHAAGDELLTEVARRLRSAVREIDTPGRFGGDEFVVVCPDLADVRDVVMIAERIRQLLEEPFHIRGMPVFISASVGIAVADAETDAATLLGQADTAAYRAKDRGRNRYEIFDEDLRASVARRLETETGLRYALAHDELCLVYQPIVEMSSGGIAGFEALVRWERDGQLHGPAEFLAVAEETGLIVPLGQQVLEQACHQIASWRRALPGVRLPRLSVNLSARQLAYPDLARDVRRTLAATGVHPEDLCLEITETVLMQDTPQASAVVNELRDLGLRLAIDDFGTGYSSLSYLRRLPVSAVKIDRSFTVGLGADDEGATIVASVISLAHALGMEIIAEGVETNEHVEALLALGCDQAQGYFFSRPVAPEVALDLIRAGAIRAA
jgi:diguanylate cyclase (GGDEF)-like protein/PAS domain S-box-containing protein